MAAAQDPRAREQIAAYRRFLEQIIHAAYLKAETETRRRLVRAARAAPGAFAIEWFTRRWVNRTGSRARTFTTYLRRGKGDR